MSQEKFTLQHVVLYAKNWYKRSNDFWKDINKCLEADGYSSDWFRPNDCARVILNQFERLPKKGNFSLYDFLMEIEEQNCWKIGYYTKKHTWVSSDKEYDMQEAIVRYCLSSFLMLDNEEWEVCKPDYKKVLPVGSKDSLKRAKEIFVDLK